MSARSRYPDDASTVAVLAIALLAAGFAALTLSDPGTPDIGDFLRWSAVLGHLGPTRGYAQIADYPPLGPFILWAATTIGRGFGLEPLISIKLALDAFQLASAIIIRRQTKSWAAAIVLFLLLTPFGALLGYVDVFYLPFILLGILALQSDRLATANLMFAAATLIKWQPALLCPVVVIYSLGRTRRDNWAWPMPATLFSLFVIAAFGPAAVWTAFMGATNDPLFSGQAFNIDWIITYLLEATRTAGTHFSPSGTIRFINHLPPPWYALSRALFWILYLVNLTVFAVHKKTGETCLLALLSAESIQFTCNTGVHENHAFLIMILAFIVSTTGRLPALQFAVSAALAISNILAFYGLSIVAGHGASLGTVILAALDILMCGAFIHRHVAACHQAGLAPGLSRFRRA